MNILLGLIVPDRKPRPAGDCRVAFVLLQLPSAVLPLFIFIITQSGTSFVQAHLSNFNRTEWLYKSLKLTIYIFSVSPQPLQTSFWTHPTVPARQTISCFRYNEGSGCSASWNPRPLSYIERTFSRVSSLEESFVTGLIFCRAAASLWSILPDGEGGGVTKGTAPSWRCIRSSSQREVLCPSSSTQNNYSMKNKAGIVLMLLLIAIG